MARQIATSLQAYDVETWICSEWDADNICEQSVADTDIVVSIGGDGAMLRTARICALPEVPILGVNMGNLGFLTEINPTDWTEACARLVSGDYWIENRMMVRGEIWRGDTLITTEDALNDVVLGRGATARSVHLDAYINGDWTTSYNADGVIAATPTGSTAYALAVGGPILPPELDNIMLIPVAPHLSIDRPLVLPHDVTIKLVVNERNEDTQVAATVDGRSLNGVLKVGDYVIVQASERRSRFIRMREQGYFYRSLLDRFEPRFVEKRHQRDVASAPQPQYETSSIE